MRSRFVDLLREYAGAEPLPLIRQARGLRTGSRRSPETSLSDEAQSAAAGTASVLGRELKPPRRSAGWSPPRPRCPMTYRLGLSCSLRPLSSCTAHEVGGVTVEISNDLSHIRDWFEVAEYVETSHGDPHAVIRLRMSLRHPLL